MSAGCDSILLTFAIGCVVAATNAQGAEGSPQISQGVRAMMFTDKGAKFGPEDARYTVIRQPPIYGQVAPGATHFFKVDNELLAFFEGLPQPVKAGGLWITRALSPDGETSADRERVSALVKAASAKDLLLYVCEPMPVESGWLIGWKCAKQSPRRSDQELSCVPRAQPYEGHPWWDCSAKATN